MIRPLRPRMSKSGWSNSSPPDNGAPVSLVRPMNDSWSPSGCRSQTSIVMLIRRTAR